jgi:hypothetical protein
MLNNEIQKEKKIQNERKKDGENAKKKKKTKKNKKQNHHLPCSYEQNMNKEGGVLHFMFF